MQRTLLSVAAISLLLGTILSANEEMVAAQSIVLGEEAADTAQTPVYIAKKPVIECRLKGYDPDEIETVLLDDTDITDAIEKSGEGFVFKPMLHVAGGKHTLTVILYHNDEEVQEEYTFKTRQSRSFETMQTKVDTTLVLQALLDKSSDVTGVPYTKAQGDVGIASELKDEAWSYAFRGNLRYLDQSAPVESPLRKGFDLAGYLFSAAYTDERMSAVIDVGDVEVTESEYGIQGVSSRGAQAKLLYDTVEAHAYLVDGTGNYGWYGGMGLSPRSEDHLYGGSVEKTFFEATKVRVAYLKGGRTGEDFGTSDDSVENGSGDAIGRAGQVLALVFETPVIGEKLHLAGEYDLSDYDADTRDEYGKVSDHAWNVKLDGYLNDHYSYNLLYEYIGDRYASIGAEGIEGDNEGYGGAFNAEFDAYSLALTGSRYHDNVGDSRLYARVFTTKGGLSYAYRGIENTTLSASLGRSFRKSDKEPTADDRVSVMSDLMGLGWEYAVQAWMFHLGYQYAKEKDNVEHAKSIDNVFTFTPSYTGEMFHVEPSFTYEHAHDSRTEKVETYTVGLALGGMIVPETVTYDISSTYERRLPDESAAGYLFQVQGQIAYNLKAPTAAMNHPVIGLRATYNNAKDAGTEEDESETPGNLTGSGENYLVSVFLSVPLSLVY